MTGVVQRTISSTAGVEEHGVRAEFLPFVGMLEEGEQAARHRVSRRLVPGDDEEEVVRQELDRRQRRAVQLAVGDETHDVVVRLHSPPLGELVEVGKDLEASVPDRFFRRVPALELGILGRDDLIRPAEEQLPVAPRDTQHLGDHRDRDPRNTSRTKSPAVVSAAASSTSRVRRATFSSKPRIARGVNQPLASRR